MIFEGSLTTAVIGTCVWAGVDSAWEQEKPEARKMLENAAESHTSGARFVSLLLTLEITQMQVALVSLLHATYFLMIVEVSNLK
jgi:hypothetical protein